MSATVIRFDSDGTGHCLYTEQIPLASIGELQVKRASRIEFDEFSQEWEVWIEQQHVYSNPSRARCLEWEHEHFNEKLLTS